MNKVLRDKKLNNNFRKDQLDIPPWSDQIRQALFQIRHPSPSSTYHLSSAVITRLTSLHIEKTRVKIEKQCQNSSRQKIKLLKINKLSLNN